MASGSSARRTSFASARVSIAGRVMVCALARYYHAADRYGVWIRLTAAGRLVSLLERSYCAVVWTLAWPIRPHQLLHDRQGCPDRRIDVANVRRTSCGVVRL